MGRLEEQARAFATRLTEFLNGTVTTGCLVRATLTDEDIAIVSPAKDPIKDLALVPLSTSSDRAKRDAAPLSLRMTFTTKLDSEGEHLMVETSMFGLCVNPRTGHCPFRVEYDRDKRGKQAAHLQLSADSAALGYAYGLLNNKDPKPLHKLHFPLGDKRFRPSVEDFVEFLRQEGFISEVHQSWKQVLNQSRADWHHRQLRAAVRRDPLTAISQLEAMGYHVSSTDES